MSDLHSLAYEDFLHDCDKYDPDNQRESRIWCTRVFCERLPAIIGSLTQVDIHDLRRKLIDWQDADEASGEKMLQGGIEHENHPELFKSHRAIINEAIGFLTTEASKRSAKVPPNQETVRENLARKIMEESKITRPQAKQIVCAMVHLGATSEECAKPESDIMKTAGVNSRIAGVFSDRSGDAKNYSQFRKLYIKNTGTRKGLYYLKLS